MRIDRLRPRTLINPNYTRLWYGQATSSIGDSVFTTTLVLWVVTDLARGKTWAPAAVSTVLLSAGVAVLAVGPVAGVFVDRWDSRITMMRTDQIRCVIVFLLTAMSFVPAHDLPLGAWLAIICTVVVALNGAGQFFVPARTTVVRDIVTGDADRARAAGIAQATGQTAMIVGPPLAAPLLFTVGLQWGLLFNALSYVVSFITIRGIRLPGQEGFPKPAGRKTSFRGEFVAGLRFFGQSRLLVTMLSIAVIGQVGVSALGALDVFFLTRNLHAPLKLYGYMGTALGVGGIVGAIVAGRVVEKIGVRATAWLGLIAGGALLIIYSRQVVFIAAIAILFLAAIPITTLNTAMAPMLMGAAPREYLGRISAVFQPITQVASLVATLLAGWLVSSPLRGFAGSLGGVKFNPIDLVFGTAGLLIVIAGIYAQIVLPRPAAEPVPSGAQA